MATVDKTRGPGRPSLSIDEKKVRAANRMRKAANELAPVPETAHSKPVVARYDAAGNGRRLGGWQAPASGPNRAIEGTERMRDRARDAVRNDWAGAAAVTKWTTTLIGIAIRQRFDRIVSKSRRQAVTDAYTDWSSRCDSMGILSLPAMQTQVVRGWLEGGETFVVMRNRAPTPTRAVPLVLQVLESDYCPRLDSTAWPGMPIGNYMTQGIEFDPDGMRTAFWFFRKHPGDGYNLRVPSTGDLVRIPADQVCHVFDAKRGGQVRGVSSLDSILVRLRNSMDFEDVVLDRQKLANLFTMFITRELPQAPNDIDYDDATGLPKWYDKEGQPISTLQAGMSQELSPGEDVKFTNPPEAGTVYSDYMRTTHMGTASGVDMPYELFAGDIRQVSDRTLRVLIQEYRRFAEQRQWQIIIPMFCQPVVEAWSVAATLVNVIRVNEVDFVKRCTHAPHGFENIHPVQDPQGKILEVQAGFRSRSDVIGERGDDPIDVDNQRQVDMEREKALGLPDTQSVVTPTAPKPGTLGGDQAGSGDDVVPPKTPAATMTPDRVAMILAAIPGILEPFAKAIAAREVALPTA